MSWRDGIEAELPPPLDGESADLRQDIIDELADHLVCAMQRERKCTDDDAAAQRAVIERFGNPGRIAYRLWFDAMKETIMSQRISLVTNIVVAMACIAIALVAFNSLKQNTALTNALLTKLEAIGAGTEAKTTASVWAEATIPVLVSDQPAVGYDVSISGDMFNPGKSETLRDHTGEDGIAAFGPIRPGKYSARVKDPSGLQYSTRVVLFPGEQELDPVIMPVLNLQPTAVSFALDLPEVLKDHAAFVRLDFDRHLPETDVDDRSWRWPSETLLVRPNGTIVRVDAVQGTGRQPFGNAYLDSLRIDSEALEFGRAIELDASLVHRLKQITVVLPIERPVDTFVEIKHPLSNRTSRRANRGANPALVPQYFDNLPPFRPAQGQENVWTIEIPEWLVEAVQQRVEAAAAEAAARRSDDAETGN
ncbi:MAG: hypothetical protein V3T53_01115 [Phycisphaerales bacterium]